MQSWMQADLAWDVVAAALGRLVAAERSDLVVALGQFPRQQLMVQDMGDVGRLISQMDQGQGL
jgi:hypothetical protein